MNAFEFGRLMQKIAVGPFQQPTTPKPAPQFNFGHARQMLAKHDQNYNTDMTSRQVWDRSKELGTIAPGSRQLSPFQAAMKYKYRGKMPAEPAFAGPGKPGFKPQAPVAAQVAQAAPIPRMPAQPQQPRPQQPAIPNWQPGQPVPAGFVVNDNNQLMPQSQDFQRLTAQQPAAIPRFPGQR